MTNTKKKGKKTRERKWTSIAVVFWTTANPMEAERALVNLVSQKLQKESYLVEEMQIFENALKL